MRVLMVAFVYNELPYLWHAINFWYAQGVDVYIIDNFSNDGTWEWLQENKVSSHRFSTNETFDLKALQKEAMRIIHKKKPDWVITGAADLYINFGNSNIKKTIAWAERHGFNQIETMCWMMKYTGEKRKLPFVGNYLYGQRWTSLKLICKYDETLNILADYIDRANPAPIKIDGVIINYGGCKTIKEQETKLARRKKAWENGLNKDWGVHFTADKTKEWVFTKEELSCITQSKEKLYHEKIIEICKPYEGNNT